MARPRVFVLLVLLVAPAAVVASPAASAAGPDEWAVRLVMPPHAGAGLPFLVDACLNAPAETEVQLRVALEVAGRVEGRVVQAGQEVSGHRYGPAFPVDGTGRVCRTVEVRPPQSVEGDAELVARVRPEGGAAKADARAPLRLVVAEPARVDAIAEAGVRLAEGVLRAPVREGTALVPLLADATALVVDGVEAPRPPPLRWRLVEARGGLLEGLVVENEGERAESAAGLAVERGASASWPLPEVEVAPNGRVLLASRAAPGEAALPEGDAPDVRADVWRLVLGGVLLDEVDVPVLRAGEAWRRDEGVVRLGRAHLEPDRLRVEGELRAYATPDAGAAPLLDLVDGARGEVLAELYTLTSPEVAAALARAALRGVDVRVLLEGAPAGGRPPEQDALVAALVAHGAHVAFLESVDGFPARFRTQHAKVFVVDREWTSVATENPTPSSYPAVASTEGTRGFGLLVRDPVLASRIVALVEADLAPWPDVAPAASEPLPPPSRLAPRTGVDGGPMLALQGAWDVRVVVSPDGSDALLSAMENATRRIDVAMLRADAAWREGGANPFLDALVDAARRGIHVRLLLDGRFADAQNEAVVARLQALAAREALPLEARLAAPQHTLHAKTVLLDGNASYVGSMNWGYASARENREIGLIVDNATLALWLTARFEKEWDVDGEAPAPGHVVPGAEGVGLVLAGLVATLTLRRRAPGGRS